MIFIVYSETNSATIEENFGKPEYSYFFVLKEFLPLLERLGTVVIVTDPAREVDPIYNRAVLEGEPCVFVSFTPPHWTPLGLACPTVPVFAWEFDTIPYETWFGERFQDWRFVLNKLGRAITHSNFSVRAVKAAMGQDFPIMSIPAPVWDRFATLRRPPQASPVIQGVELSLDAAVIDSRTVDWSNYSPQRQLVFGVVALPQAEDRGAAPVRLQVDGVIYTSIVSSYDDRKNCFDMLEGFCWALRDCEDATLILKMGHDDSSRAIDALMQHLYMLTPFKCRVILIDGYLKGSEYERLMRSTTFAVNTSTGEGQCLPLMEYMSYGTPAIAPRHTGMMDYISADNAFVVGSTAAPAAWPQDPRGAYRTLSRRIDCESLSKAYRESHRVAKEAPDRYRAMAEHARRSLEHHCASAITFEKLRAFFAMAPRPVRAEPDFGRLMQRNATYSLGNVINFVSQLESCRFLTSGWSKPELGYGVWSDGPISELTFRIEPKPTGPLILYANLSAFVNSAKTEQTIDVSVNEISLAQWEFNFARPEKINHSWREVLIPLEIALRDEIRIKLCFGNPVSPRQLGLSSDSRLLGVTLHELSILPQSLQASVCSAVEIELEESRLVNAAYAAEINADQQIISQLQEDISGYQRELAALEERKNRELRYASWLVEQHKKLVDQQKNEVSELLTSKSYRLGHAIMVPGAFALHSLEAAVALILASLRNPRGAFRQLTIKRILRAGLMLLRNPRQLRDICNIYASRLRNGIDPSDSFVSRARRLTPTSKSNPLVSILIVNFNGKGHLETLFDSLSCLAFKNYETIMIDNGSTDGSVELVRSRYPKVRIIKLENNVGFAEANNIGFETAKGGYICLLNNDTRCDPEFLTHLVDTLESDPNLGAVGPKIRFWSQFLAVEINVPPAATAFLDVGELYKGASDYQKAFFQAGFSEPFMHREKNVRRISGKAKLLLPEQNVRNGSELRVFAEAASTVVTVWIGGHQVTHVLKANSWHAIPLSAGNGGGVPEWIINNAGSRITMDGNVSDRGFGSADNGYFDVADEPEALCGCAMLVRRAALNENEPLFAKEFFAYFEDTDLSLRLRGNGYRLAYCPKSIVYHKHASTSGEESIFFKYYVNRNRILFYALHFPEQLWREKITEARRELAKLKQRYQPDLCAQDERGFGQRIDNIFADWERLLPQIAAGRFYDRTRYFPRLAVYDSFWNTKGGGEYHAGIIAEALQTLGPVDLICEQDFSIEDVEQQFAIDLSHCRKVIVTAAELHHDMRVTERYDVFVNSTYGSDLISSAKRSIYIVSFPYRVDNRPSGAKRFLATYDVFLANSNYTKAWCRKYWDVEAETLYPSVRIQQPDSGNAAKTKIILNVGRFFTHGHNKKQLELVEVFKNMMTEGTLSSGWKLVLVGQVEYGQEDYYNAVQSAAHGMPVEIYPNISRAELTNLYEKAAIYWHATGLGEDLKKYPDRAEHFGIATIEAMAFGCVPVVIGAGGQCEIVEDESSGYLFTGVDDLKEKTAHVAKAFDHNPNDAFLALSSKARARAAEFSKERTQERFLALLASARQELTMRDQQSI